MSSRLFPADLPSLKWVDFDAAGFTGPVTGVIYPADHPATNGMPLGGLGTGCIDLETSGLLGYLTIFNSLYPRRGPLNIPFLGVKIDGTTHLLASTAGGGLTAAKSVQYWGHYPVADIEYELDAPLSVGVRAWSPFVPGDVQDSMIPAAVFEVHLRNTSSRPIHGTLAGSFPGHVRSEAGFTPYCRQAYRAPGLSGALGETKHAYMVANPCREADSPSYILAVVGERATRLGYALDWNPAAWQAIDGPQQDIMLQDHETGGASVATDFQLPPGGREVIRFVLAWHAPVWAGGGARSAGGNRYRHMYAKRFPCVEDVAAFIAANHESLLRRILAWQGVIYAETQLPPWLRDSLINILHLITETAVWGQSKDNPLLNAWCKEEDGLFALNECPRHCPQLECLPCSFYGNLPVVYFFPQAALSTLRGYKAYQRADGRPAWVFGGVTVGTGTYDLAAPKMGYQASLNGFSAVEVLHKYWKRTGDRAVLAELYDFAKRATEWTMTLNTDPEGGVISMPVSRQSEQGIHYETEWFEAPEPGWRGMATHVGGVRLAQCLLMKNLAHEVGDEAFARQCQAWFDAGAAALDKYLWVGTHYRNFVEKQTGQTSDLVFGYQLDGQWISRFHGVGNAFPPDKAALALETIERINVGLSKTGATNYANADGSAAKVGGYGPYSYFHVELLMLAMTYMYEGRKDFGIELARRCWENVVCAQRLTWDIPNFVRGDKDTGERAFGADYYQLLMLWSLPAAIEGTDIAGPCRPGGLVDRVIRAAMG